MRVLIVEVTHTAEGEPPIWGTSGRNTTGLPITFISTWLRTYTELYVPELSVCLVIAKPEQSGCGIGVHLYILHARRGDCGKPVEGVGEKED